MSPTRQRFPRRSTAAALLTAAVLTAGLLATKTAAQYRSDDRRDRTERSFDQSGLGGPEGSAAPAGGASPAPQAAAATAPAATGPASAPSSPGAPAGAPAAAPAPAAPPPPPQVFKPSKYSDQYALLEEKNIFMKTRERRRPGGTGSGETGPRPPATYNQGSRRPEESLVLTGIALQEGRHVAFVENTSAYTTTRLTPGQSLASGKIVSVERDHVEYESNGQRLRIDIGRNFTGGAASVGSTSAGFGSPGMTVTGSSSATSGTAAAPPAGAAPTGPPLDPNNPNLSIEERMRLRRAQEKR